MSAPDNPEEERGFLTGWSRRKLAAKKAAQPEPEAELQAESAPEREPEPEGVNSDYIDALPSLDSIGAGSDIKPFLVRGVPESLKNAALRRLWSATPGVRDYLDPAVDYAWDWNAPGGVPGGGGVLSPSRVAKMLENLAGGRPPEPETQDAPDTDIPDTYIPDTGAQGDANAQDDVDADSAAVLPQTEAPPAPPSSLRRSDPDAAAPPHPAPVPDKPASAESAAAAPPRRHGGAVPG
jgi:hypothetical protein